MIQRFPFRGANPCPSRKDPKVIHLYLPGGFGPGTSKNNLACDGFGDYGTKGSRSLDDTTCEYCKVSEAYEYIPLKLKHDDAMRRNDAAWEKWRVLNDLIHKEKNPKHKRYLKILQKAADREKESSIEDARKYSKLLKKFDD